MKVRICYRCKDIMEDGFILTPCTEAEYKASGLKLKDRCDQCRRRGQYLVAYNVDSKRKGKEKI